MKKQIWIQTVIIFLEDAEKQFHKTFKSMDRVFTLLSFNRFKTNSFNKWFKINSRLDGKVKEKEVAYKCASKLYLSC
jgi:hypothetical protein